MRATVLLFTLATLAAGEVFGGVGFEFTLDYGVASIFVQNRSYADVARVEGSSSYRQAIRSYAIHNPDKYKHPAPSPGHAGARVITLVTNGLRDYLPPWLGGRTPAANPFLPMMRSLKVATESYLEHEIDAAQVTFPVDIVGEGREKLQDAASTLSVTMPRRYQPPSGHLAAFAHDIRSRCPEAGLWEPEDCSPAKVILAIELTDAALVGIQILDETAVFETLLHSYDSSLGARVLRDMTPVEGHESVRQRLAVFLREVTQLSKDDMRRGLHGVSELVLHGDHSDDPVLEETLKQVLREQRHRVTTLQADRMTRVPPLFAAARGVARDCYDRLSYDEGRVHREMR